MTRLESWRGVPIGTRVIVRRSDGSHFEARTASRAFEMLGGAAVIRVDGNAVQDYYPLDRVSLGYNEPRPVAIARVPLALALDPPPDDGWSTIARAGAVVVAMLVIYVVGFGLGPVLDWLVAP